MYKNLAMYYMYPIMESTFDNDFTDDNELPSLGIDEESVIPAEMTDSAMDDNAGQQETFNDYGEYIYITISTVDPLVVYWSWHSPS